MRVLIYRGKHDLVVIKGDDVDAAHFALMHILDGEEYYGDIKDESPRDVKQKTWYDAAIAGDKTAATKLVKYRKQKGYEYECNWHFEDMIDPKDFEK